MLDARPIFGYRTTSGSPFTQGVTMFAKKNPLPEAWTVRPRRWYLKDAEFLSEIGGALAFMGLFLMICVGGHRAAEEGEAVDALTANLMVGMLFITYGM